jgi:membrane associated rhomboid family serine protease
VFPIRDLNPTRTAPVLTVALILANVAIYFFWQPHGSIEDEVRFTYAHAVIPCEVTTLEPLTIGEINSGSCSDAPTGVVLFPDKQVIVASFTSMFLHGGLFHLLSNMWVLWIFGNNIEEAYGRIRYALLYLVAGIVATAGFILIRPQETVPLVGASGAIAGVLGAYLVLYSRHIVLSLVGFWLLPVPAWIFLGIWFVGQFFHAETGVAWEAHVFGFLAGFAITALVRPMLHVARGSALRSGRP